MVGGSPSLGGSHQNTRPFLQRPLCSFCSSTSSPFRKASQIYPLSQPSPEPQPLPGAARLDYLPLPPSGSGVWAPSPSQAPRAGAIPLLPLWLWLDPFHGLFPKKQPSRIPEGRTDPSFGIAALTERLGSWRCSEL